MSDLDIGKAALRWWHEALSDSGRGRANRAKLRRTSSAVEALGLEATHELHKQLGRALRERGETLALIAVALANIRDNIAAGAPERMEKKVKSNRFERLVRITEPGELITPMRRALISIDGQANVPALARDLFYWSDKTRNDWCFAYYGARHAAPEGSEE